MRVLVIDDESLAQATLARILERRHDVEQFDCARDAFDALEKIKHHEYDLMLLDIHMPELSGIQLIQKIEERKLQLPRVIFITAHDQYAIAAFERHALDYVLKPFTEERIQEALDIAVQRTVSDRAAKLAELLPLLQALMKPQPRLAIKNKGRIVFVDPANVTAVEAQGNYVLLRYENSSCLLRESISDLARKLEGYGFIRIHRSLVINTRFVESIGPLPSGEYHLKTKNGKQYVVTRTFKNNLKSLAQFWIGTGSFSE